jgi:starvation-inducible DNA-binding protein
MFNTLRLLFETQYTELALAWTRSPSAYAPLGFPAPRTCAEFARLSSIRETQDVPTAEEMVRELVEGQEAVVRTARATFPDVDRVGDEPSTDLLTQHMQVHEKNAWMLRSVL